MRLFVAFVPPDEVAEHLAEHLAPRIEAGPDLRWSDPHQWHVTVAFLAQVPDWRVEDLTGALASSAARREPLQLRVAGSGAFPNPYAARCSGRESRRPAAISTRWPAASVRRAARWGPTPTALGSART